MEDNLVLCTKIEEIEIVSKKNRVSFAKDAKYNKKQFSTFACEQSWYDVHH